MGAQWKQAGKIANSNKKGAVVGKLVKEIMVAVKLGGPNPDGNSRLRAALEVARRQSVTRDTIDRAVKKGAGLTDEVINFETLVFEGFAPHKVPVIVECLTDNKNRTAADIRVIFRKGQLGNQGSVSFMFDRLGVVEATLGSTGVDIEGVAIEAGAQNVEPLEAEDVPTGQTGARFFCDTKDLDTVSKFLTENKWAVSLSEMSYVAKNPTELEAEQKKEVADFLITIDDHDDVHRVYAALKS